ncbi:hypothetical protein [Paracoccus shanxieyensis]|uniref:Uncharacterized protein n=1 Tax=Paracoccus shanxieyensis TaxID=2675752 RepID=A0A6L6IX43_9RHOB|nr:hypothetical protein [Paracoccus shanxieyensis]MTH65076.1 hypothetical protein [Paracoccus shanxieyensis]MTH88220.1 hypothetical protein [Paracoccus shanxieyensis]
MCADPLTMALTAAGAPTGIGGFFGSLFGGAGLGGIGTAASAASGVVGAYSAIQQGNAAAAAAEATAKAQEAAATDALRQGEDESDRQRRAGAAMMAQQRVATAANGVDASSASALEMLDDTKRLIEDDAFAIRQNAQRQAEGFGQAAANSRTEASNARSAGRWEAAGTLLTTGARVGSKYSQWALQRSGQGAFT